MGAPSGSADGKYAGWADVPSSALLQLHDDLDPGRNAAAVTSPNRLGWLRGGARYRVPILAVTALIAALFANLLPPFDLLVFIRAGRAVLDGVSPYSSVHSSTFLTGHAFVYPLFVAWIFAPVALLPLHVAEVLCEIASVGAVVGGCRLLGRREPLVPVLVLASATTIVGLQMGTINAFLMLGLGLAWRCRDRHPILAGVLIGLIGAGKLFLLPLILWPLVTKRYRSAVAASLTAASLIGAGIIVGPVGARSYVAMLGVLERNEVTHSWSLASMLSALGVAVPSATKIAPLLVAPGLALLWGRRHRFADKQVLGLLILASLLASPILWSSYLLLAQAALLLVGAGELTLAFAGLASWVLVTPDVASPVRIAIGAALSGALFVVMLVASGKGHRSARWDITRALRNEATAKVALALVGVATLGYLLLPPALRSPLPALGAIAAVGLLTLRPSTRFAGRALRWASRRPG